MTKDRRTGEKNKHEKCDIKKIRMYMTKDRPDRLTD